MLPCLLPERLTPKVSFPVRGAGGADNPRPTLPVDPGSGGPSETRSEPDGLGASGEAGPAVPDRLRGPSAGAEGDRDEVKSALSTACRRAEMMPDQQQLQSWAQLISDGTRIVFDVSNVRP